MSRKLRKSPARSSSSRTNGSTIVPSENMTSHVELKWSFLTAHTPQQAFHTLLWILETPDGKKISNQYYAKHIIIRTLSWFQDGDRLVARAWVLPDTSTSLVIVPATEEAIREYIIPNINYLMKRLEKYETLPV